MATSDTLRGSGVFLRFLFAIMIVFGATLNYVLAYGVTGRTVQEKHPASTPAPS